MIDVELDQPTAETWMRSFTDLRLALATRLGVEQDDDDYWESLPDEDPRARAHDIYDWVGLPAGDAGPRARLRSLSEKGQIGETSTAGFRAR